MATRFWQKELITKLPSLVDGKEYADAEFVAAGVYEMTITGIGNYEGSTGKASFTISEKSSDQNSNDTGNNSNTGNTTDNGNNSNTGNTTDNGSNTGTDSMQPITARRKRNILHMAILRKKPQHRLQQRAPQWRISVQFRLPEIWLKPGSGCCLVQQA